jgi:2-polyprenyl-3-methyl-5-hydroxy-6-metoxy-1,4-benzoquinol methylase
MNKLRQTLYESYDAHFLRAKILPGNSLSAADYRQHLSDYETCYGDIVSELPNGSRLLDLGCGTGFLLFWLAHNRPGFFQVTGVDFCEGQLALARKHLPADVALVREEATAFLERNASSFAAVFCTHMLEHIETDDELLRLLELVKSSLVPGGLFICEVPNMANLTSMQIRYIDLTHSRGFTSLSLLQLLESVRFRECEIVKRKAADTSQWVRMSVETLVHRVVYRICGAGDERHFHRILIGMGKA